MSGIGAIFNLDGAPVAREHLERMANALRMHGPDGRAVVARGPVGLVFTLHRFTPEDFIERQPVSGGGGRWLLVMDGRIDNRDELAAALAIDAPTLRRLPDSALFMRAFEAWGEGCFNRIVGEFAIILWDTQEQRLLCARDHFGLRPLAYYQTDTCLAVASMPKGLFALPWVPRELNEQKLADYLILNFCDGASTYFKDVRRLLMAHVMTIGRDRGLQIRRYWNLMDAPDVRLPTDDDYVDALREKLDVAVRAQLRSATPVGAFMSGGLDSSTVAVTAAGILAERGQRLPTFTAVPEEGLEAVAEGNWYADETPYVEAIARKVPNIELNLVQAEGLGLCDRLDDLFLAWEAPPPNAINMFWFNGIYEQALARGTRVLLGGDLGNCTISYHGRTLLPQLLVRGEWRCLWGELRASQFRRPPILGPLARLVLLPSLPNPLWRSLYRLRYGRAPFWRAYSAIHPSFAASHDVTARAASLGFDRCGKPAVDGKHFRANVLIATAAPEAGDVNAAYRAIFAVEGRDPTCDRRVAEFCLGVPEHQFLRRGRERWLIRRTMAHRLPPTVLDSTNRGLQAADWFPRLTAERERLLADLKVFASDSVLRVALDLPMLINAVRDWSKRTPDGELREKLRNTLLYAVVAGRFARWVRGLDPRSAAEFSSSGRNSMELLDS